MSELSSPSGLMAHIGDVDLSPRLARLQALSSSCGVEYQVVSVKVFRTPKRILRTLTDVDTQICRRRRIYYCCRTANLQIYQTREFDTPTAAHLGPEGTAHASTTLTFSHRPLFTYTVTPLNHHSLANLIKFYQV
ncbi:hypothetical protein LENED_010590 [Lentinula edodes]|uniref:Uncharacterized protein n=1 Tax=Lentinula edodes TaxID=5353 RepID=A0A1Q3EMU9_LENED|nr:hypothetical protein LENED_010590 [Lentinula edodes]